MRRSPRVWVIAPFVLLVAISWTAPAFAQREWRADYTASELAQGGAILSSVSTPLSTTSSGNTLIKRREGELDEENKRLQDLLSWMELYLPENEPALIQAIGLGQGSALQDVLIAMGCAPSLSPPQQRALRAKRRALVEALEAHEPARRARHVYRIFVEITLITQVQPALYPAQRQAH